MTLMHSYSTIVNPESEFLTGSMNEKTLKIILIEIEKVVMEQYHTKRLLFDFKDRKSVPKFKLLPY